MMKEYIYNFFKNIKFYLIEIFLILFAILCDELIELVIKNQIVIPNILISSLYFIAGIIWYIIPPFCYLWYKKVRNMFPYLVLALVMIISAIILVSMGLNPDNEIDMTYYLLLVFIILNVPIKENSKVLYNLKMVLSDIGYLFFFLGFLKKENILVFIIIGVIINIIRGIIFKEKYRKIFIIFNTTVYYCWIRWFLLTIGYSYLKINF